MTHSGVGWTVDDVNDVDEVDGVDRRTEPSVRSRTPSTSSTQSTPSTPSTPSTRLMPRALAYALARIRISTRRFSWRPSAVSFDERGRVSPKPQTVIIDAGTPWSIR